MGVDVQSEIVIDRPRRDVAGYASDPDNAMSWYQSIRAVTWASPKPLTVGSRIRFEAKFLNRRLIYTYEVRQLIEDQLLVMSTHDGPFPMETSYLWEQLPSGETRMTLRNRGEPSGFSKLAAALMAGAIRRANRKDLARLKAVLEGASAL